MHLFETVPTTKTYHDLHAVAFHQLLKFDDAAIEIDPATATSGAWGRDKEGNALFVWTAQFVGKSGG